MSLRVVSSVFSGTNRILNLHDTHPLLRSIFFKPANIGRIRRTILFSSYGDRSRESVSSAAADVSSSILDDKLLISVSAVRDADEALTMISERFGSNSGGIVELEDCRSIISAAVSRGNVDLALSIFYAMRASFDSGSLISTLLFTQSRSFCD